MSLSERLHAAKGQAPAPPLTRQEPGEAPVPAVDVGIPAPCPQCGGRGFLDLIEVRKRRQYEHCVECRATWHRPI